MEPTEPMVPRAEYSVRLNGRTGPHRRDALGRELDELVRQAHSEAAEEWMTGAFEDRRKGRPPRGRRTKGEPSTSGWLWGWILRITQYTRWISGGA